MKKKFTFCNLKLHKRLLGLLTLFLICSNVFSQTICRPTSETNSQGGLLCVGLNVDSPANAYDSAGLSTFATLTSVVGVGCFVEETLNLGQTARAGDQIAIYFGTGNGLLDVSLLSNASIQTKFNGTNVGSSVALNSPLLNLNLLTGNTVAVAKYTLTGDANQVQIQVGGLVNLLTVLRIYDVRLEYAQPTVAGGLTQTVCSGSTATLTATPAAGTTIAWYGSASSTTALATGNTFTTPALTNNTTYYIGISRTTGCEGNVRVPVVLNVSNPVAPAVSNTGTTVCSSGATQQTTLSLVNAIPGTTYSWYSTATGGTALATGTTYSPTVPLGTTSFYVEGVIGTCISPTRTQVNVVSTAIPATPTVLTQSVTIQSGQNATLSASTSEVGAQLNWYDVPTGGTAVATNTATFTTPILTATKTYYVEAQSPNGSCVSAARVPVLVTVQPASLVGCLEAGSQQIVQNGVCLLCSSTNPNNAVDGNPATATRLNVPVGLINGYVQQTLQFNNPGKAGDIVDVEMELPGGLADLSLLGAVSLATYNGATYNNDRVAINNPLITLQLLSGNRFRASVTAGANFDRVEIRLGGLATVLTSADIYQATYRFKAPTFSGTTTICSGQTATVTASLAVGETVNWYSAATGGTSLASTATFTTPALTAPTTYYVQVTRNGCVNSERNPVQILITNPVVPVVTASPTTICSGQSTTLTVQAPITGTTYNWYDAATGGNLVFTGTSFTTPALAVNTSYYVEAAIGDCTSATRTAVNLTVSPIPATPTFASSNVIIQSGQTVTLSVQNPVAGVRYNWFDVPTGGASIAFNTTSYTPNPALTANKTYYVEAVNVGTDCANPTRGAITVTVIANASTCLQAGTQITSRDPGLLCVACTDINPNNSVDGNINTFAQLSIPVGLLGSYIEQTLIFANPGQTGDIIDVDLELPGGLADVTLLGGVSLATFNGAIYNNDRTPINNSLIGIQLLSGNKFKASFKATAPFDRVEIRLGGLATVLSNLYIYQGAYRYPDATVTGAAAPICVGGTASLTASSTGTETYTWYDAAVGGNIVAVNPTAPLTASTTYYLQGTRGTCENSIRQAVTVNVLPIPTAADIVIPSPAEATCAGGIVLNPSTAIAGAQFKYYTDQNKTQEIITGTTVVAQPGVTFTKDATTGALTIAGLNAAGTPYNYFIAASNGGTCENVINDLKQVTVNFPSTTVLTVNANPAPGCGSFNLGNAITNFDSTGNTTYTFYDPSNNVITADAAANITTGGVYSIEAQRTGDTCPAARQSVTVVINALPSLVVTNPQESVNVGTNVTLTATSTGTVTWFDPQGNALAGPPFTTGALSAPGVYTYTAVASDGTCSRTATKVINVIDLSSCQSLSERVYATGQSFSSIITGTVTNGTNAVDGNPQTFSTITTGVGLLGVGTTWQSLTWPANIVKGTPVTVKLGSEYSLLAVGQNLSVVGTKNGVDIGAMQSVSGSLLNLISGDNTYEFTFVPSDASGPQDYDGIRIQSASLVSVAQNTKVFDAHYNRQVATVACTPGDIQDIFYGATDLVLPVGAVTAAVGVSDAWNIADNDVTTFATMYSGVGALVAADLTVQFKTPSVVSDTLRIVISKPGALLDVNLLTGFTIQRYLGNVAVGAPIQNTSTLLSIRLLPGNSLAMVLVSSPTEIYDRVRIRLGGVAGVLDFLRVHTVERTANTTVIGADPQNKITVCPGSTITLQIPEEACSTYIWYDAITGGNSLSTGISYTLPANLPAGIYKYYVQPVRYGCETFARGEVTVEVKASAPVNALTDITLNGGTSTSVCTATGSVTLATSLSGTPLLTNPVYSWYSFNGTTSQLIPGETTAQLIVNGLAPGTYTYYVGVTSDQFCLTAEADRKQITFTILPPSTANDILVDDVTVCHDAPATLTPTAPALASPLFTWYLDANKTQPIANGAVINGVTYTISAAGELTATGLTEAMSPITYHVAVSSTNTCENLAGTLQDAVILINDPNTPTTLDNTQDFCLSTTPTVANLQVNETNVVWYTTPTGGLPLASTTPLANGVYYAGATDIVFGCESSVRLAVTVTVTDPGTPTLVTAGTQNFCLVDAPTFASIQTAQTNIVWYTAATGGTLIPSTTALTTGQYFAAISDPTTGCESATRLTVDVIVNNPTTPTLVTAGTQNFCLEDAPTFASIQTNEGNIVWYTAATGGTLIPSTTALTTGQYFAAILDPATGCASATRLTVDVIVNDPGTPTLVTAGTQNFCQEDAPTFASIQTNQANIVWYTAATGGTLIPSTTVLTTGQYFAAISDPASGCESATRLTVDVIVNDPGTPTLVTAGTQNFCLVDAPTFASIQTTQTNIVWYTAATGGTLIPSTTALTTGQYFAAISDPASGCESATRLTVDVIVNNPATPTLVTAGTQNFCLEDAPTFASIQTNEGNIVWYTSATGGTLIPSTTALTTGQYFAAILDPATACASATRLTVDVIVNDPGTPTLVTAGTQNFCQEDAPTFASIQTTQSNIVWYTAATGGTQIPSITVLTTGQYFAAISDPASGCESATRLTVDVIVNDPGTPTLVTAGTQNFCQEDAPTFASIQTTQTNIVWYTAATGGTQIPSTTALTTGQYFAAISDPATGCESSTRLTVDVLVTDPATPTTTSAAQTFCSGTNPTVANIQVNESNVIWFTTQTGGTALASTTALTTATYYGAIKDPVTGCESSVRLQVAVTVGNTINPTTNNAAQTFCSANAPTIANIQVNESNVTWYTSATGGTPIAAGTALTSGIYFGNIVDAATGCESTTRLQVTVTVVDPAGTPTTANATQNFCTLNSPTVANIQVNEANVVWYRTATGGTALPATTALTTGIYYGAISSAVGCENPVRLAVTVNVNAPSVVTTTSTNQKFCLNAAPTVANIQVNEANVVYYTTATGGTPLLANTPLTATTYYAAASSNTTNGCDNAPRLAITVSFENDAAYQITTTDDTPCVFKGVTYSIANGKSNYLWTIVGGTIVSGGSTADGSVTVSWSDIGPGTVTVAYVNTCDERTIKTLNVSVSSCSDLTITNTVNNPTPNFGEQVTFTVTVNNVGEGDFINTIVSNLIPSGLELVSSSTSTGTFDPTTQLWTIPRLNAGQSVTLTIVAEVLPGGNYTSTATVETSTPLDVDATNNSASVTLEPICLTVYNEFTPNNDGKNDFFRIDCIETHPNNELKVFNRYGALVYSKVHYENDWDGTANVSGVVNRGDMLPTGTYFYVITIGDGTVKKGWLSIMR
ncbi:gliding motility-associated C-terminal domain-containing protein [Flavobacterium sp. YJ01]|uniref:Ig-like domain-containing protein n=1 Tax=Flavobacterium sp. YJ01 TaxID=3031997 RepID=UPI0023E36F3F|nr:gliding motility-associated C-terminal domain-containing protein [Flavobacterium sp. YJ01]WET03286.1 gliding motility-associated C-terminal domain-containing protein [Flavobacterium sp. YJ01]